MRLPIVIAAALVAVDIGYRYVLGKPVSGKQAFSWVFILVALSVIGLTPMADFSDIFAYIIIVIILLNDGYDIARSL